MSPPPLDPALERGLLQPALAWFQQRLAGGGRRPVLALNGPVGAGKSSFSAVLQLQAAERGLQLAVASIDDLYWPLQQRRQRLAGNPFGVTRVPPGSHDVPLLREALTRWRQGEPLRLPRFDKRLARGEGDRSGWTEEHADGLLLEGWLLGCQALGTERLERVLAGLDPELAPPQGLSAAERAWLPHWDGALATYSPLWQDCDGLLLLRPQHWRLPRRWRFQAEARQRRGGGGWLAPEALEQLVRSSLCSLPPTLYQDPLLHSNQLVAVATLNGRRQVMEGPS